jgi:hypothetical protein
VKQSKQGLYTGKLIVQPGAKKVTVATEKRWKSSK